MQIPNKMNGTEDSCGYNVGCYLIPFVKLPENQTPEQNFLSQWHQSNYADPHQKPILLGQIVEGFVVFVDKIRLQKKNNISNNKLTKLQKQKSPKCSLQATEWLGNCIF